MPDSGVHEVEPNHIKSVFHKKNNQGVDDKMRKKGSQLHWQMRGQEMGNKPPKKKGRSKKHNPYKQHNRNKIKRR